MGKMAGPSQRSATAEIWNLSAGTCRQPKRRGSFHQAPMRENVGILCGERWGGGAVGPFARPTGRARPHQARLCPPRFRRHALLRKHRNDASLCILRASTPTLNNGLQHHFARAPFQIRTRDLQRLRHQPAYIRIVEHRRAFIQPNRSHLTARALQSLLRILDRHSF